MQDDRKKRRNQINGIIGGVIGVVFVVNLAIGIATMPPEKPKAAATPTPPTPVAPASPQPRPPLPPAMVALGEKAALKTKADLQYWGSSIDGSRHRMLLLPKSAWEDLSKTEKAALTYYVEAAQIKQGGNPDNWTIVVSYSDTKPYGVDTTIVAGAAIDRSGTSAQSAEAFRSEMLTP